MPALEEIRSTIQTVVHRRLFAEYGAVFVTRATPPPKIVFRDSDEVNRFQQTLSVGTAVIGEHRMRLQTAAMNALLDAQVAAREAGLAISARSEDSGARTYEDTVGLWLRNVGKGLDHWTELNKLSDQSAEEIRRLTPVEQIEVVLDLENSNELWFGTFFDKSILYSVAAPGASQHLSLLAFDVAEYQDDRVRQILNDNGWFRTVPNDLPHFTYLGYDRSELESLGLEEVKRSYGDAEYAFWIPASRD